MPRIPSHSSSPNSAGNSHANHSSSSSTGANPSASFNNTLNNAAGQQGRAGGGTTQAGAPAGGGNLGPVPSSAGVQSFQNTLNQNVLGGRLSTAQGGLAPAGNAAMIAGYEAQGGSAQTRYRQAVQAVANGGSSSDAIRQHGIDTEAQQKALARLSSGSLAPGQAMTMLPVAPGRAETRVPFTTTAAGHGSQPAPTTTAAGHGSQPSSSSLSQQVLLDSGLTNPLSRFRPSLSPSSSPSHSPSSGYGSPDSMAVEPPSPQRSDSSSNYANDFFTRAQNPTPL